MAYHPVVWRSRPGLLCSTALVGVAFITPLAAQPAPNARPQGGQVVAGGAQIGQTASTTTVTQSTQRAAVDWQSFNVGAQHTVNFAQPNAQAVILNRVTGPDPSAIAGSINANGQVVITNPSGVVFHGGAQVNAAGIVVSAPGITNQNFMAGRMVFDQAPKASARVENHGTITVKEAGLAALVAPAVANSGTINARMGRVVLAGAAAHTLDMYGDGLVSLDVTSQVREAPRGPDGKPVATLVTNTGTIRADGGVVQLTAAAADGVVSTLVQAGGRVRADTTDGRTGRIEITGTGGSVIVEGRVSASGRVAGAAGGAVVIAPDGAAVLAPTARVSANGHGGGGTVAVGTTLARARTLGPTVPGTSARAFVAAGARVSADGRGTGSGGRVTVLSSERTQVDGTLTARGGKQGGDGGTVEISAAKGFGLTGTADTSAPRGKLGQIVLDPFNLDVVAGGGSVAPAPFDPNVPQSAGSNAPGSTDTVTASALESLVGSVRLQATNDVTVRASVSLGGSFRNFTIEAGNNVRVEPGVTITTSQDIRLSASSGAITGATTTGTVTVLGNLTSTGNPNSPGGGLGNIFLDAGTGGIALGGTLTAQRINLNTPGAVTQTVGALIADVLSTGFPGDGSSAGPTSLQSPNNRIGRVGFNAGEGSITYVVGNGSFALVNGVDLTVDSLGVPTGSTVSLTQNSQPGGGATPTNALTINRIYNSSEVGGPINLVLSAPAGVEVTSGTKTPGLLSVTPADLANVNSTAFGGGNTANTLTLRSQAGGGAGGTIVFGKAGDPAFDFGNVVVLDATGAVSAQSGYARLNLDASGAVTQLAPIAVTTLAGQAGTLNLRGDNFVSTLDGFTTSAGELAFHTGQNPLLISAPVVAVNGTANVDLSSSGGTGQNMTLAADVRGATVSLNSLSGNPSVGDGAIVQTGGIVTAGTLTLAGGFASLGRANQVTNLGTSTTGTALSLTTVNALGITGNVTNGSGAVSLTAPSITQSLGTTLDTGLLNSNAALASFDSPTNRVRVLNSVQAPNGSFSITNSIPLGIDQVNAPGGQVRFVADRIYGAGEPTSVVADFARFTPLTPGRRIELIETFGGVTAGDPNSLSLNLGIIGAPGGTPGFTSGLAVRTLALGQTGQTGPINFGDANQTINLQGRVATLQLETTGAVTQGAGATLSVPDLVGTAGSLALGNGNAIASLGLGSTAAPGSLTGFATAGALTLGANSTGLGLANTITAGGTLAVTNTGNISSSGQVSGPGISLTSTGAGVSQVAGSISTPGTLTLNTGAGGVSQTAGTIAAGTLAGTVNGAALLNQAGNAIAALGALNATGDVTLVTNRGLTVTGPASGGAVALQAAGPIQFAGNLTAASTLSLNAAGAVTQTAGIVQANALTGQSASASLTQPGNLIAQVGPYATTGGFTLVNGRSLTVFGQVTDPVRVSLQAAGDLNISSLVRTGALSTVATGNITAPAAVQAQTLTGSAGGQAVFNSSSNSIGTLGAFTTGTGLGLRTSGSLVVDGPVTSPNTLALNAAGGLQLAGIISTGALATTVGGALSQPGGTITAQSLSGQAGSASLGQSGNAIAGLGTFASTGDFSLTTAVPLAVTGTVSAGTGQTLGITADQTSFAANSALQAPGGTVQLAALSPAGLTVSGTATPNVVANTLRFGQAGGGPVTITGPLTLTNVPVLDLRSAGAITATGPIQVGTLTGAGASATLTGANRIGTLGQFTTTGALALSNATGLQVSGPLSAGSVALDVSGDLGVSGDVSAPTVRLGATGRITQTAGLISAPVQLTLAAGTDALQTGGRMSTALLTGSAGGSLSLPSATNDIATLGPFTTGADFLLRDGRSLVVVGAVDPGDVLIDVAGNLTLNSSVTGATVTLQATGAITEGPGGYVEATTLTGRANQAILSGDNRVARLGDFTTADGFLLTDRQSLAVTGTVADGRAVTLLTDGSMTLSGAVSAPTVALTATGVQEQVRPPALRGNITQVAGTVTAPTSLTLTAAGAVSQPGGTITQPGGAITAGTLTGRSGDATSLTGVGNAITTLGSYSSSNGFALRDSRSLAVTGPVADSTRVSLQVAGDLQLNGAISTGVLSTAVTGAITQPGGAVTAQTLSGNAASAVLGQAGNAIGTLGPFTTTGALTLNNAVNLQVSGITAGTLDLTAPNIAFTGSANTGTLVFSTPGQVTQSAGRLTAETVRGTAGQGISLGGAGGASIAGLGETTSGGTLAIASDRPLTVTGPLRAPNVQVSAVGQLTLAGGTVATSDPASSFRSLGPAAAIVQTGTTAVVPLNGTTASLRLQLPGTGGTITLNDLQAGGVDLTLALGTGRATGALTARSLLVDGAGGSATLTGSVAGQGGFTAAEVSRITPAFSTAYILNDCAIASVSCVVVVEPPHRRVTDLLTTLLAPQTFLRPLIDLPNRLDLTVQRERDDPNLLLPNISDRDY